MKSEKKAVALSWVQLRSGNAHESGLSIPTVASNVKTEIDFIRFALSSDNKPRLLLPVSANDTLPNFPDTAGILIIDSVYKLGGKSVRFIDVTCLMKDLESVFDDVVEEIIRRVENGETCSQSLLTTLKDFQALLIGKKCPGLSDEELTGLMGEMVLLRDLLLLNSDAWSTWQGPLAKRHDFRSDLCTFEVKTTSRPSNYQISINSIDQLEIPTSGELYLVRIVMEYAPNSEMTFRSLLNEIKQHASQPDEIDKRLKLIGIDTSSNQEWDDISFKHESSFFYKVTDKFPRIIPESFKEGKLPIGITSLKYQIDLSLAHDSKLDNNEVADLIQRFIK